MSEINVQFCFYDDPRYITDVDRDSYILQDWHRQLWSKDLPSGDRLVWAAEPGEYLTCAGPYGPIRVSSDTLATTHSRYPEVQNARVWTDLSPDERDRYERAFYTIGGFIIFPVHTDSLNQLRGRDSNIADRFDLTLECIRQHYLGQQGNPLSAALEVDAEFFGLFGDGLAGSLPTSTSFTSKTSAGATPSSGWMTLSATSGTLGRPRYRTRKWRTAAISTMSSPSSPLGTAGSKTG